MAIKLHVAALSVSPRKVKKVFHEILTDYCARFNVLVTEKPVAVSVMFISQGGEDPSSGMVIHVLEPVINDQKHYYLVQIRDPWISGWEDNPYAVNQFLETISHEFIHICQFVTGREGIKVSKQFYDSKDDREGYYFCPKEIEARALSGFYNERYTYKILE